MSLKGEVNPKALGGSAHLTVCGKRLFWLKASTQWAVFFYRRWADCWILSQEILCTKTRTVSYWPSSLMGCCRMMTFTFWPLENMVAGTWNMWSTDFVRFPLLWGSPKSSLYRPVEANLVGFFLCVFCSLLLANGDQSVNFCLLLVNCFSKYLLMKRLLLKTGWFFNIWFQVSWNPVWFLILSGGLDAADDEDDNEDDEGGIQLHIFTSKADVFVGYATVHGDTWVKQMMCACSMCGAGLNGSWMFVQFCGPHQGCQRKQKCLAMEQVKTFSTKNENKWDE